MSSKSLDEEIEALLDYNPFTLVTDPAWAPENAFPFWFYDKHLDSRLSLSRVERMASLSKDISDLVDRTLSDIKERGIELPQINNRGLFTPARVRNDVDTSVNTAGSVARYYCATTASYCGCVASTLALHPSAPTWRSTLMWNQRREPGPIEDSSEGYALRLRHHPEKRKFDIPPGLLPHLTRPPERLQDVVTRFSDLATWVISDASDESVALLRDMDRITESGSFSLEVCCTSGHQPSNVTLTCPPDAHSSPWSIESLPLDTSDHDLRRSLRSRQVRGLPPAPNRRRSKKIQEELRPQHGPPTARAPGLATTATGGQEILPSLQTDCYSSSTERFLQHAWNWSVRKDTTIIVFHSGNYERIGVRHRQSQTLYLSDLIDVAGCKNPAYGKIHLGLYIAAIEDALDRAKQLHDLEKAAPQVSATRNIGQDPQTKKRKATDIEGSKRARAKVSISKNTPAEVPNNNDDDIFHKAAFCDFALFRLQYSVFNSTSPASFLRIGHSLSPAAGPVRRPRVKRKYLPHEYLTLILHPEIGSGATGILHDARLEITTGDSVLSRDIVAKFAFTVEQQKRMRHEYSIYSHLAASSLKTNTPDIYGMFEDLEGGGMALLMSNGGKSLWECRSIDVPNDFQVKVIEPERTAFLDAISRIHQAGVHHRDIRPNNFLINHAGEITIIDFDNALLNPSKGAMRREYNNLALLLDGEYDPPDGLSTEATTDSAANLSDTTETS